MDTDLFLVIGAALAVLAVPSAIGAFSESRPPRFAALMGLIGCGMITYAIVQHPDGYELADFPAVLIQVIARVF